jgi:hypothetical protein
MTATDTAKAKAEIIEGLGQLQRQIEFYQDTLNAIAIAYRHRDGKPPGDCFCASCVAVRALAHFRPAKGNNVSDR